MMMMIIWAIMIAVTNAAPDRSAEKLIISIDSHGNNSSSMCKTPICVQEALTILRKIDRNVNPCDNFYKFACGRFLNETVIPDNELEVNSASTINHKIKDLMLIMLSDEIKKDDLPVFQSMKSFYQKCTDTEKLAENTEKELKQVLTMLGDWPILHGSSWNGTIFNWQKFVTESGQMGYDTLYFASVYVDYDSYDATKYIIQIDYPVMKTTPKILPHTDKNNTIMEAYRNYMREVALILGANFEGVEEDVLSVIEFEQKLINISDSASGKYRITVGELEKKYPKISWIEFIDGAIASNIHVDQKQEVSFVSLDFLEAFYALITVTPNRVLANYGMWRIIRQSLAIAEGRLSNVADEFLAWIYGQQTEIPRRDVCVSLIKQYFSTALGSLYVRFYFDEMVKTKMISLIDNIRASLHNIIEQANWMDRITRGKALDKLDSMSQYIGYPDELINDEKLNDYYQNVEVHPDSFLRFHMSLRKFIREKNYLNIIATVNTSRWIDHSEAYVINALYYPAENSMDIRAGILQNEFFNEDRPNYMNYGAIGWIIGHEMTHGFDNKGSQFDKNGDITDWWQPETKEGYLEKVDCFIRQYNNYTVEEVDMAVNGEQTLRDNIADSEGLKAAYYAYNKWARKNDREPQLPGLDYTPQQMFWITAANSRCEKIEKEHLKSSLRDEEHSPSEFRVIGSMSNLPEFSKDFQCPPQSPMNPNSKCTIW